MDGGGDVTKLLTEIRDTQREHLAEYRRVSQEILGLQSGAVGRQGDGRPRVSPGGPVRRHPRGDSSPLTLVFPREMVRAALPLRSA